MNDEGRYRKSITRSNRGAAVLLGTQEIAAKLLLRRFRVGSQTHRVRLGLVGTKLGTMRTGGFFEPPVSIWCERRDSNPHGFPHWILSPARLPVPPLSHSNHQSLVPYTCPTVAQLSLFSQPAPSPLGLLLWRAHFGAVSQSWRAAGGGRVPGKIGHLEVEDQQGHDDGEHSICRSFKPSLPIINCETGLDMRRTVAQRGTNSQEPPLSGVDINPSSRTGGGYPARCPPSRVDV